MNPGHVEEEITGICLFDRRHNLLLNFRIQSNYACRHIDWKIFIGNKTLNAWTLSYIFCKHIGISCRRRIVCKRFKNRNEEGSYIAIDPEKNQRVMQSVKDEVEKLENLGNNPIIITHAFPHLRHLKPQSTFSY